VKKIKITFDGGLGDILMLSAAIRCYSKIYPDHEIFVQCPYYDLLWNNPRITGFLNYKESGDFDLIYDLKPYKRKFNSKQHWNQTICDELKIMWDGLPGDFYPAPIELEEAQKFIQDLNASTMVIQPFGSVPPLHDGSLKITDTKDWFDDLWQELIDRLSGDFKIIQVGGRQEKVFDGVINLVNKIHPRQTGALLKYCHTWISIESFLPHMAACINKPGIVLYGRSSPYVYGYKYNDEIFHPESCQFAPCNAKICGCGRICMKVISVDSVTRNIIKFGRR